MNTGAAYPPENPDVYFFGLMDEVGVWTRALDEESGLAHFHSPPAEVRYAPFRGNQLACRRRYRQEPTLLSSKLELVRARRRGDLSMTAVLIIEGHAGDIRQAAGMDLRLAAVGGHAVHIGGAGRERKAGQLAHVQRTVRPDAEPHEHHADGDAAEGARRRERERHVRERHRQHHEAAEHEPLVAAEPRDELARADAARHDGPDAPAQA